MYAISAMTGLPEREPWQRPELVLAVPGRLVPAEFRDGVAAEVAEADRRARVSLPRHRRSALAASPPAPLDVPTPAEKREEAPAPRLGLDALRAYMAERDRRSQAGLCIACGVPYDEQTPGCHGCESRHAQRAANAEWSVAERIARHACRALSAASGRRCKFSALPDSPYCGIHFRISRSLLRDAA